MYMNCYDIVQPVRCAMDGQRVFLFCARRYQRSFHRQHVFIWRNVVARSCFSFRRTALRTLCFVRCCVAGCWRVHRRCAFSAPAIWQRTLLLRGSRELCSHRAIIVQVFLLLLLFAFGLLMCHTFAVYHLLVAAIVIRGLGLDANASRACARHLFVRAINCLVKNQYSMWYGWTDRWCTQ